jgi:catechol 2,3-dioxygenase-like lactoylglutathione lyase family enzyme
MIPRETSSSSGNLSSEIVIRLRQVTSWPRKPAGCARVSRSSRLAQACTVQLMFDHVKFGVSDYAASRAFFQKALAPLGVAIVSEGEPTYGVELCGNGTASLCLYETQEKPAPLHLAFTAANREQVEAFYRAALDAGGKDNGAPGLRPHYHASYYAAFVIGPDGHNVEAVCHEP